MENAFQKFKDKMFVMLLGMVITIFLSLAGWTMLTVYTNSGAIKSLSDKKQTDVKQWENIKDLIKDVSRLKTFHEE
tara:strand:+ start:7669 stop:7896 length:228 start_codon:yes stop_codon:yes gene_type:complete